MTARPIFIREEGYKVHICETHRASRLPFHWSVIWEAGTGAIVDHGRSTSEEYARHDARSAISEHKQQLEERAA